MRRVGETITVNAQLISTETGAHVWADRFDGERGRLGQLQVEFVARLANSLGVELVRAEALRAMRERPNNPDAVDLSMRGWAELKDRRRAINGRLYSKGLSGVATYRGAICEAAKLPGADDVLGRDFWPVSPRAAMLDKMSGQAAK